VRVTTAFNRLLKIDGITVSRVEFGDAAVTVTVRLRRRRLCCPLCDYSTRSRYDTRTVSSSWRALDLGSWPLIIKASLRRLACPTHGVRVEGVPFARHGSGFTRDFEDLVAWLATRMDKTAACRLTRIDWATVGRVCQRAAAEKLDPDRLDELYQIGVDEVSWRKHHKYLTLVVDHRTNTVVWGAEGKDTATLDGFFDELGEQRSAQVEAVSMDLGPAFRASVTDRAPQAVICYDPFHVVKLGTEALNTVRRTEWQQLRELDPAAAKTFKGARWALLKNPDDLTDAQADTLTAIKRSGLRSWRAYQRKEELRAIFDRDLSTDQAAELLHRWCARAQRSRLEPFIKTARTLRKHRDGVLAAIHMRLSNARLEGLNQRVRLIIRRAYGFHSATAALALIMLTCGPVELTLPWENQS
jgi:transposase